MKHFLVSMLVLGLVGSLTALAEEKSAPKSGTEKTVKSKTDSTATEFTLQGTLSKEEGLKAGNKAKYILTLADGEKLILPETKASIGLDKLVGQNVKVVGKGKKEGEKKDKLTLKSITSVEPMAASAAKETAASASKETAAPAAKEAVAPAETEMAEPEAK